MLARQNLEKLDPNFATLAGGALALQREIELLRNRKASVDLVATMSLAKHLQAKIAKEESEKPKRIVRLIALAPDVVARVYQRMAEREMRILNYVAGRGTAYETDEAIKKRKLYDIVAEQARAVAGQKAEVTRLSLAVAKQKSIADMVRSQFVLNIFNSIYIDGYSYTYGGAMGGSGASHNVNVEIYQRLGNIADLIKGAKTNKVGDLINLTAILQAQAGKAAIAELFGELGIIAIGTSRDNLLNASEQLQAEARRKVIEAEHGPDAFNLRNWGTYQDLLDISMACDSLAEQALLNTMANKEAAKRLFNQKVRQLLGTLVNISAAIIWRN